MVSLHLHEKNTCIVRFTIKWSASEHPKTRFNMIQRKAPFVCLLIPGTLNKKAPVLRCSCRICRIKVIGLDNFFNVYHLLRHRLGHTTQRLVMFGVQWEASSSITSKPLITQKDIDKLRKAQTKNSGKLDKHAQTSSSGFAKKYTRFQFILQCFPGLEWDHEGKTCSINIPPETPTAWLVLSRFNLHFFGEHGGICVLDGLPPQQVDPTQVAELPCAPKCRHNGTIWI